MGQGVEYSYHSQNLTVESQKLDIKNPKPSRISFGKIPIECLN